MGHRNEESETRASVGLKAKKEMYVNFNSN